MTLKGGKVALDPLEKIEDISFFDFIYLLNYLTCIIAL